jgi:hypothetical protein
MRFGFDTTGGGGNSTTGVLLHDYTYHAHVFRWMSLIVAAFKDGKT